jgi:hypothetical protein
MNRINWIFMPALAACLADEAVKVLENWIAAGATGE